MSKTQASTIPQIQSTKNYAQFQLMKGNRSVDYNHVKRLKREMQMNPELLSANPILVNEHMFIIDGQHRRQAAQELGYPVYYIVMPGGTLDETRHLNVTQRRWQLLDFARSYADSGRQDYKIFLDFHKEFPAIAPGILRTYLAGGQKHELDVDFRRGEFAINDEQQAKNDLEKLSKVVRATGIKVNAPMAHALLQLLHPKPDTKADPFEFEVFYKKFETEGGRELLQTASSIRGCLRSIENVYNYQSKWQKRLY